MKVAAGILCWNQIGNERRELFERCYASIIEASPDVLVVADNGSTDGTAELIAELPEGVLFPKLAGSPHGNTCGYGMNKLAATLLVTEPDIIVLSNDDIVWQPDAFDRLRKVWAEVPEDVTIISGLLEPVFSLPNQEPWNKPYGVADVAGEVLMFRKSAPGGAWTFRASDFGLIFPVSTFPGVDDVPACHKLIGQQKGIAALDLAENAGIDASTWGNGSYQQLIVESLEDLRARYGL
jgi:glycosyltransferase involved in cell wall biosynthesis